MSAAMWVGVVIAGFGVLERWVEGRAAGGNFLVGLGAMVAVVGTYGGWWAS